MSFRPAVFRRHRVVLLTGLMLMGSLTRAAAMEEIVSLMEGHKLAITIPDGFKFTKATDDRGVTVVHLNNADHSLSMDVTILPDFDGTMQTARGRKEFMFDAFQQYVETSVEKAMQFEELEPRKGSGSYCVFTDAKLVGKTTFPPDDYLTLTAGVKAWKGAFAFFNLFANDPKSQDYKTAMQLLRESFEEKSLGPVI